MTEDTDPATLKPLLDTLLPGAGDWPPAGEVISEVALPEDAKVLARRVAALPSEARAAEVAAYEASDPAAFAALYRAVADAYYATPEAARILARRASAGPPDPTGPSFDPRLLDRVVAERRGQRRL